MNGICPDVNSDATKSCRMNACDTTHLVKERSPDSFASASHLWDTVCGCFYDPDCRAGFLRVILPFFLRLVCSSKYSRNNIFVGLGCLDVLHTEITLRLLKEENAHEDALPIIGCFWRG